MGDGTCSSQRGASNALGISVLSVNRIVKSSPLKPYKYKMVQELKETDPPKRLQFFNLVLSNQLENPRWSNRTFFSDEVSLSLNGTDTLVTVIVTQKKINIGLFKNL